MAVKEFLSLKLVGIKKFIYFSVLNASKNKTIPLIDLKLKMENELENSGLNYTIFQRDFFQGLISQYFLLERRFSSRQSYLDTRRLKLAYPKSLRIKKSYWGKIFVSLSLRGILLTVYNLAKYIMPSFSTSPSNEISWPISRLGLENYLQEYFGKILKKLRETNYQQSQKSDEISFL